MVACPGRIAIHPGRSRRDRWQVRDSTSSRGCRSRKCVFRLFENCDLDSCNVFYSVLSRPHWLFLESSRLTDSRTLPRGFCRSPCRGKSHTDTGCSRAVSGRRDVTATLRCNRRAGPLHNGVATPSFGGKACHLIRNPKRSCDCARLTLNSFVG